MKAIETVEQAQLIKRPPMRSGDTVRVHVKVREGDKERIQVFEGMVIGDAPRRHARDRSRSARCRSARASSASFRCTRRRSTRSKSSAAPRSAARSCTSCAICKGKAARMKEQKRTWP